MTAPTINGSTRIIAHLGVPTESFKAPLIYNPWFAAKGINAVVVPMGAETTEFKALLPLLFKLRNIAGALITMPHKITVVGLLDESSTEVQICGACNAVRRDDTGRLIGEMFDGLGFVRAAQAKGRKIEGASALVVGAGGVGSAIAASLARAGLSRLRLSDLNLGAAQSLAERLKKHYPAMAIDVGAAAPEGMDILVNATPLGMKPGDAMPFDLDKVGAGMHVGEVVLTQKETALVAAAKARGCSTQIGLDMLFEMIPAYLAFFGFPPATAAELMASAAI